MRIEERQGSSGELESFLAENWRTASARPRSRIVLIAGDVAAAKSPSRDVPDFTCSRSAACARSATGCATTTTTRSGLRIASRPHR
ncbi:hypothetical protein [Bradyrhizobium archetypum]|uniref:Uncharacterized protein n=1 Tax=Bradyrhizobium archetypum TaxID=2721160 RepID=A0A7Y4M182_9BRAD|nr:hypothetical protein [Bradyrhizobium archetypum]NOJ45615.1 hypothetical protein [Bradyrhizobium archetypum]